jgi:hypothetical protein
MRPAKWFVAFGQVAKDIKDKAVVLELSTYEADDTDGELVITDIPEEHSTKTKSLDTVLDGSANCSAGSSAGTLPNVTSDSTSTRVPDLLSASASASQTAKTSKGTRRKAKSSK